MIPIRWIIGGLLLMLIIGIGCSIADGMWVTKQVADIGGIQGMTSNIVSANPLSIAQNLVAMFFAKYSFFESGFGIYLRIIIIAINSIITLDLLVEVLRLIKPF